MPIDLKPRNEKGLAHGLWETYFPNGQLDYRGEFVNGIQHGYCESYWPDGDIFYMGSFNMRKRVGHWIIGNDDWSREITKIFYAN